MPMHCMIVVTTRGHYDGVVVAAKGRYDSVVNVARGHCESVVIRVGVIAAMLSSL